VSWQHFVICPSSRPASYGSLARFKDIQRLHTLGNQTVIAVSGDMSDYQWLQKDLDSVRGVGSASGAPGLAPALAAMARLPGL
jgi:20S proteasome subunit beta 7